MKVRQIENVLDLLEYFEKNPSPCGIGTISSIFGWPRSSTFNIVSTLVSRGYLYEPRPREGFYPTTKWSYLLSGIHNTKFVPPELCQAADQISEITGETVVIGAPAGHYAVWLYVAESKSAVRLIIHTGDRLPIQIPAAGRALLSLYSSEARALLLKRAKYTEVGDVSLMSPEAVEAEMAKEVAQGWFESRGPEYIGISVPLHLPGLYLALSVGGPTHRMDEKKQHVVETLQSWRRMTKDLPDLDDALLENGVPMASSRGPS